MLFGFTNSDNTCYINCVLQMLLSIKPLRKSLSDNSDDLILNELTKIIKFYDKNTDIHHSVYPKSFLNSIFSTFYFSKGRQEDAHEFLLCLLDHIHEKKKYPVLVELRKSITQNKNTISCKNEWEKFCGNNYSIITKLFYGQIKKNVICNCGKNSISREPFCGLTISSDFKNIEDGINDYIQNDVVETKCEKCNEQSFKCINKYLEIVPEYLIVQISRFNNNMTKNLNKINYLKDINLSGLIDTDINKNTQYTLKSCIYHAGQLNYGHYLCSVNKKNDWYVLNDDHIIPNSVDDTFFKANSYILLYKKLKNY